MTYGRYDQNLSNETNCQVRYAYSYVKYILLTANIDCYNKKNSSQKIGIFFLINITSQARYRIVHLLEQKLLNFYYIYIILYIH